MLKIIAIKKFTKHIVTSVLLIAVLLPFAVQFIHSFENHEHICDVNDLHLDEHKIECSIFHFKINQDSIDFSTEVVFSENDNSNKLILSSESQQTSFQYFNKASRAPPSLLL